MNHLFNYTTSLSQPFFTTFTDCVLHALQKQLLIISSIGVVIFTAYYMIYAAYRHNFFGSSLSSSHLSIPNQNIVLNDESSIPVEIRDPSPELKKFKRSKSEIEDFILPEFLLP